MKALLISATVILLASTTMSSAAIPASQTGPVIKSDTSGYVMEARRGRGGDRNRADRKKSNDDNGTSGSKRRKPRVPGGSGCDDAGDIAEHAECTPKA